MISLMFALAMATAPAAAVPATCSLDYGKPVPCRVADRVDGNGGHATTFTMGQRILKFVGKSQTGWWSGTLDGKPAMGVELNRGHVRFSTTDLATSFDYWFTGQEHGTY